MAFKDFFKIQKQGLEGMASVGVIGMHMVSGPLVGVAIGYGIDKFFDTHPWGKIIFLLIGIGAGFLNVYMDTRRLIGQMNKSQERAAGTRNAPESGTTAESRVVPGEGKSKDGEGADHGEV